MRRSPRRTLYDVAAVLALVVCAIAAQLAVVDEGVDPDVAVSVDARLIDEG